MGHAAGDIGQVDTITVYLRGDFRATTPNIVTLNGLYDLATPWADLQVGARVGESASELGGWSYKFAATSKEFLGNYRASFQLVKNNIYVPVTGQSSIYMERVMGTFNPFEWNELLSAVEVTAESGVSELFWTQTGTNILPNTHGHQNLIPLFALRLNIPQSNLGREYSFTFGNFDIFDPYPASQPYVQFEGSQIVAGNKLFSYIRYRWDTATNQFFSLYLTLGVEIPN